MFPIRKSGSGNQIKYVIIMYNEFDLKHKYSRKNALVDAWLLIGARALEELLRRLD